MSAEPETPPPQASKLEAPAPTEKKSVIQLHHEDGHEHKPWFKTYYVLIAQYCFWGPMWFLGFVGAAHGCEDYGYGENELLLTRGIEKNACRFWQQSWAAGLAGMLWSYIPLLLIDKTDRSMVCLCLGSYIYHGTSWVAGILDDFNPAPTVLHPLFMVCCAITLFLDRKLILQQWNADEEYFAEKRRVSEQRKALKTAA